MKLPGVLKNKMWKFQGPRIEFTGVIKKKSCGISMSLGYWILSFQEDEAQFWEIPGVKLHFICNFLIKFFCQKGMSSNNAWTPPLAVHSWHVLPRWLFPSKIYIQFIIFNTYFSTKLSFTKKDISPARAREVSVFARRCQGNDICLAVSSSSFSLFTWQWNKLCCHVLYQPIGEIL